MSAVGGKILGRKLIAALGLPNKTLWFEIRCHVNEPVIVKCGYFPDDLKAEKLVEVFKEYELREKAGIRYKPFIDSAPAVICKAHQREDCEECVPNDLTAENAKDAKPKPDA